MRIRFQKLYFLPLVLLCIHCGSAVPTDDTAGGAKKRGSSSLTTPNGPAVGTGVGPGRESEPSSNRPCRLRYASGVMRNCREALFDRCSWDKEFCAFVSCDAGYIIDRNTIDAAVCIPRPLRSESQEQQASQFCHIDHGVGELNADGKCVAQGCNDGYFLINLRPLDEESFCAPI